MNVNRLTELISDNRPYIETILDALGYTDYKYKASTNYYQFSRIGGDNPTAMCLYCNTLKYVCFTRNDKGNIFSLVMKTKKKDFVDSMRWICKVLGLKNDDIDTNIRLPFGGYYKKIIRELEEPELNLTVYDDTILNEWNGACNQMFFEDGISYESQEKFQVGYDLFTQRITVPQFDVNGRLVGVMGRLNDKNCDHNERWFPIIPCRRAMTLYGYHQNYRMIQNAGMCLLVESEKSVMQLDTMKYNWGLATCGCNISDVQARYIKGLMNETVIVGFDEGLEEEIVRHEASKLVVANKLLKNRVGYIYDADGDILPKGSKSSPTDLGKGALKELIQKKVVWLT